MDIKKRTEALLLAANRALSVKDIVELLEIESAEEESEVLSAVVSLKEDYESKPYDLVEVSSGYRIQLNQDYSKDIAKLWDCLLYTSPSPRDEVLSRMPSSA